MHEAYKLARKATEAAAKRMDMRYEQGVTGAKPLEGDVVFVRNLGFKGKHTFANKWESNPYNVIKKPCQDISVYIVRDDQGREITLHRNHPQPQKKSTAVQPRASKSHLHQKDLYTHRRMRKSLKKLKYKHKV